MAEDKGFQPENLITDIISVSSNTEITETNAFKETLALIPGHVGRANQLLADYRTNPSKFVEETDEDDLDDDLKEINEIVKFSNSIDKSRTEIRRYFNSIRDQAVDVLDQRLDEAQFDELKDAHNDIKQLKKDMRAQRISDRWRELEPVFSGSIQHYDLIETLAPELLDFSRFRLLHSKMVSGAKTKGITDTVKREVSQVINEWNTALELIQANQWGLNPNKQFSLLNAFKSDPSISLVNEQGPQFKQQQDAEAERQRQQELARKKQEEEIKKAEEARKKREDELRKQQELAKKAQAEQNEKARLEAEERTKKLQEQAKLAEEQERKRKEDLDAVIRERVSPQARQSYPNVVEFIFSEPLFKDLHTSTRSKAAAVYELSQQLTKPDSPIVKDTNGDPAKYLDAIRFILDA